MNDINCSVAEWYIKAIYIQDCSKELKYITIYGQLYLEMSFVAKLNLVYYMVHI